MLTLTNPLRTLFLTFAVFLSINTLPVDLQQQKQEFVLQNAALLQEYPDLLEKVFGTSDTKKLATRDYITSTFKSLVFETTESSKIIIACVIAAVAYGIIQDQVTARVCLEYFSQGFHRRNMETWIHAPILSHLRSILLNSNSPTVHALVWGTVATWFVGLPFGILVAGTSRLGPWPKIKVKELVKPLAITMAGVGAAALLAGLYGYFIHKAEVANDIKALEGDPSQWIFTGGWMKGVHVVNELQFLADTYAHDMAYAAATAGGFMVTGYIAYKRYQKNKELLALVKKLKAQVDAEATALHTSLRDILKNEDADAKKVEGLIRAGAWTGSTIYETHPTRYSLDGLITITQLFHQAGYSKECTVALMSLFVENWKHDAREQERITKNSPISMCEPTTREELNTYYDFYTKPQPEDPRGKQVGNSYVVKLAR